jgi:hypothetical protein
MAAVQTPKKEIDRKLYEIFKATSSKIKNTEALAKAVRKRKPAAFTYVRHGKTLLAAEATIEDYIEFAVQVSLFDANLQPRIGKSVIRSLQGFQNWLTTRAQEYLNGGGCSANDIHRVTRGLVGASVVKLPTDKNVHAALKTQAIDLKSFQWAAHIITIFKAEKYILKSRRVFAIEGIVGE